jgi:hypothetical protein
MKKLLYAQDQSIGDHTHPPGIGLFWEIERLWFVCVRILVGEDFACTLAFFILGDGHPLVELLIEDADLLAEILTADVSLNDVDDLPSILGHFE